MTAVNPGSYMEVGDVAPYGPDLSDHFTRVQLAVSRNPRNVLARNSRLSQFLNPQADLSEIPAYSFFPPALASSTKRKRIDLIETVKTGGRTFLLTAESAMRLGVPPVLHLDLHKLGWGLGRLQLRPEVKGGGCSFKDTSVDLKKLVSVLRKRPGLRASFYRFAVAPNSHPPIFGSLAEIEDRSAGAQAEGFGVHAVRASSALLGSSRLKFIPAWLCVRQPEWYMRNLSIVSSALPDGCPRCLHPLVTEIRYTAGSVRAVYFENAASDEELRLLCRRVSPGGEQLALTLSSMIEDCRHYLEVLATSTRRERKDEYRWTKIGDISLEFRKDNHTRRTRAAEYKNAACRAWYLAKDEIIVSGLGKFFIDMESFRIDPASYRAGSVEELLFQHELFVLNVLRDHARICVQFLIAMETFNARYLPTRERRHLQRHIIEEMTAAINRSSMLHVYFGTNSAELTLYYPNLRRDYRYRFIRGQIRERY